MSNLSESQFERHTQHPDYTKHYSAGWKHSSTAKNPDLDKGMDYGRKHGDRTWNGPITNAWEDGYADYAIGRPKFHSRDCPAQDHESGECDY